MAILHRALIHTTDQRPATETGYVGIVDGQVFDRTPEYIKQTAVMITFGIGMSCVVVHIKVMDGVLTAVELGEDVIFGIDRLPKVVGATLQVDIGHQYDLGALAPGHQFGGLLQRGGIAHAIGRNSTGSLLECNFRNRTVDLYVTFYYVQLCYRNVFGHDQRIICCRGVYLSKGTAQDNRRFRGVDGQFSGSIGRDGNICGSILVTCFSTGGRLVLYGNGIACFGQRKRNFYVVIRRIYLRYHDLVACRIRQILDDNIGRAALECLLDIFRTFYFCNDFLDGAVFIEFRVDRHTDRALLGQQVTRYVGAVITSDGNIGESVVRADFRAVVVERHREVGERGLAIVGPEEVHRDRAVVFGQLRCRIGHLGRTAHFARQGVERCGEALESDRVSRRFQRLVLDFVQVVGLYHQQTERTLQGDVVSREGTVDGNSFVVEERVALVAVAHELAFLRDGFQTTPCSGGVYLIVETFVTA